MIRLTLVLFLFSTALVSSGQGYYWQSGSKEKKIKNLSVDAGIGARMYFGDIQQKGAIFNPIKFAYSAGIRYQMRPRLGFVGEFEGRKYKGKAEHGGFPDAIDEMEGSLWGGHLLIQFSIVKWEDFTKKQFTHRDPVTKMNVFIGAGFGGSLFNASYTSRTYVKQTFTDSLGQDSIVNFPIDMAGSAGGFGMYVPVQLGVRYRFSPRLFVLGQITRQVYITKNVDALATKKFDGMGTLMVRVGYTFGQRKSKAAGKTPSKLNKYK